MNDSLSASYPLIGEPFARGRIAAIGEAGQRRPIVIVLGMHRSGTSLCAHMLSVMGFDMADDIGANASNAAGHWERWEIVEFHDRILALFNRAYAGPCHDFALPAGWWADPRVCQIRREIVEFLEKRMGPGEFGFKDPRTVRLMPVWHQIFKDLRLAPKLVLCLRDPAQVARSLNARDGLDREIGEYRWLIHMMDFYRYSNGFDVCTVEYEDWFRDPSANFEKLRAFLDVEWQQTEADLGLLLSGIVDPALKHDDAAHGAPGPLPVRSLYDLARSEFSGRGGAAARDRISDAVAQFVAFQELQKPFQRAFEALADTAARLPRIEREAAALQARLAAALSEAEAQRASAAEIAGQRDARAAALENLRAELASSQAELANAARAGEAKLARLHAEIEAQKAETAAIAGDRDGLAAALASARAELADRDRSLRLLQHSLAERDVEAAELRSALSRAELAGAEAGVIVEAIVAELAASRMAENTAKQDASPAEIASLRGALVEAERRRQQAEAENSGLQGQVASLSNQLAAARDVGRAALASLRTEAAAPMPEVPRKAKGLASVSKFFGHAAKPVIPGAS